MPALTRRVLIAASLASLAGPASAARGTLSPVQKAAIIGSFGLSNVYEDAEATIDSPFGRAMVASFTEGVRAHLEGKACATAPTGDALTAFSRALFIDMAKALFETAQARHRLPLAYDRLVAANGQARIDALARALEDPDVRRHIDFRRASRQANVIEDLAGKLQREFTVRRAMSFVTVDGTGDLALSTVFNAQINQTEGQAMVERFKAKPTFKLYLDMWEPVFEAMNASIDPAGVQAFADFSLMDRFKDRLATLCIG